MPIERLFPTQVYKAMLVAPRRASLVAELARECRQIAADDRAGQRWSREHGYNGYTSYASLNDLTWRSPVFEELAKRLAAHARSFARALDWDLAGRSLELDSLWINILKPGGYHTAHIHPNSVLSGTFYVEVPDGAGALKFEDPRLGLMMAAPQKKERARPANRLFHTAAPRPGVVILWESWLRHEVVVNTARHDRISVSFNYRMG